MAISFRHLITGCAFIAAFLTAQAQVSAPVPKEVSLHFTVFALGGMEGAAYRPLAGKSAQPLKFYSAYRSSTYAYKGATQLQFFDEKALGEGTAPIAIYNIPEGAKDMLLLFFPKPVPVASGLKYDIFGIDDNVDTMPAGHFKTINVSGREYVGQYGGTRITIPQGIGEVHPGRGRVALLLAAQVEGSWMSTGRHEFSMSARDRVTLIFYPPASSTGVYPIIRRLTDTLPAPDEKGPHVVQNP